MMIDGMVVQEAFIGAALAIFGMFALASQIGFSAYNAFEASQDDEGPAPQLDTARQQKEAQVNQAGR